MNTYILEIQSLSKRFKEVVAVKDLTLGVMPGEILGLLGPNGAGKTTTINMICGLLKPDSGRVFLKDGGSTVDRCRVGVCPQISVLWENLTCLEQLEFTGEMYGMSREHARRSGLEWLETLGLAEKRDKLGGTLSGGMKRRLSLALALVHDPEIVVLDEPEAGLDPQSRIQVREVIRSLARRKTIILTTHDMEEADRLADRIAIMDHGELLVLDTPDALKQRLGEGDVLELNFKHTPQVDALSAEEKMERTRKTLMPFVAGLKSTPQNGGVILRALDLVSVLPRILTALAEAGLPCAEMRFRANTLEDVFIQLTGRRLRE
jgi:ABC-2 type transport system ATP-binding protein